MPGFDKRTTHGLSKSPEYRIWIAMKGRCNNPNTTHYYRYGGRGIKICERWLGGEGFSNFINDIGNKPTPKHTLDRINNDGDYTPENCRWATREEQVRNTSLTKGAGVVKNHRGKAKPWRVQISVGNKTIHIGCYVTTKEAIKARKQAELAYWS